MVSGFNNASWINLSTNKIYCISLTKNLKILDSWHRILFVVWALEARKKFWPHDQSLFHRTLLEAKRSDVLCQENSVNWYIWRRNLWLEPSESLQAFSKFAKRVFDFLSLKNLWQFFLDNFYYFYSLFVLVFSLFDCCMDYGLCCLPYF